MGITQDLTPKICVALPSCPGFGLLLCEGQLSEGQLVDIYPSPPLAYLTLTFLPGFGFFFDNLRLSNMKVFTLSGEINLRRNGVSLHVGTLTVQCQNSRINMGHTSSGRKVSYFILASLD